MLYKNADVYLIIQAQTICVEFNIGQQIKTNLVRVDGKMEEAKYKTILEEKLLEVPKDLRLKFTFQQDNEQFRSGWLGPFLESWCPTDLKIGSLQGLCRAECCADEQIQLWWRRLQDDSSGRLDLDTPGLD